MTISTDTPVGRSGASRVRSGSCGGRGNWSGVNIAVMVLGFVLFWPFGLALLFWIGSGRDVRELPAAISGLWARVRGNDIAFRGFGRDASTDNVVFNEYQQAQYDRIREIKLELHERARRFTEFREAARRRKDKEEFDRFMAEGSSSGDAA